MGKAKSAEIKDAKTVVNVVLPKGCKKTNLSIDALDSFTREQALATQVSVNGLPLFCRSIKLIEQGKEPCLQITIRPNSFVVTENLNARRQGD